MLTEKVLTFLRSHSAFYSILGLFTFQSLWIALSSRYPMAFDEQFHYGVIKLHAETWLPFFRQVPEDASSFGAIARDPSFLYHYLMSFPYRLIAAVTDSLAAQVIMLRLLNIGLVLAGLVIFRRLLLRLGLDGLRANVIFLFFIFIPIFPLMAGQISYDNLIFLLASLVLLLGVVFLQRHRHTANIDVHILTMLLLLCLFASMVKYAFLPVFVAVVGCVFVVAARNLTQTKEAYLEYWRLLGRRNKVALITTLLIGLSLFAGSYGLNVVKYHTPIPRCDDVLTVKQCSAYGPWIRDHIWAQSKTEVTASDAVHYVENWFRQMMRETFFMVYSRLDGTLVVYFTYFPLPIMYITAWVLFYIGAIALILNFKRLWCNPAHRLILAVLFIYTVALFAQNVRGYLHSGQPVAIHGRYLIPLILPVIALALLSVGRLLRIYAPMVNRLFTKPVKTGVLLVTLLCFLQGGGLVAYLISSNDDWMWQQSRPAIEANQKARSHLWPLVYKNDGNY